MPIFPRISASMVDEGTTRPRLLQLGDCNPGDLVYRIADTEPTICLVVQSGSQKGSNALISFKPDGPTYDVYYYDESVARFENSATFLVDHTSAAPFTKAGPVGAIRITAKGTALLVANIGSTRTSIVPFDLNTFEHVTEGSSGMEFRRWSVEIWDEQHRRVTLLSYEAKD